MSMQLNLFNQYDFTKSDYKSLLVKSIRIGWLGGVEEAIKHLSRSDVKSIFITQLFEDVFPSIEELEIFVREIENENYEWILMEDTHHGKGLTGRFYELKDQAMAKEYKQMLAIAKSRFNLFITPRATNVFWTWLTIKPKISKKRTISKEKFVAMPKAVLDCHTSSCSVFNLRRVSILSGTYENHLKLAELVQQNGWEYVRNIVLNDLLTI